MEKTYAILLPAEEFPKIVEFKAKEEGLDYYYKMLDCELIDIVNCKIGKPLENACLVVDDEGLLKAEPKINIPASLLYGVHLHGQWLAGDALLCANHLTTDGIETVGYSQEEASEILKLLTDPEE